MKTNSLGQAIIANKTISRNTPRKGQSTPNVGYLNCTQDVKVIPSILGSPSIHYRCSEKENPRIEIPTKTRANSDKLLAGHKELLAGHMWPTARSLPTPVLEEFSAAGQIILQELRGCYCG